MFDLFGPEMPLAAKFFIAFLVVLIPVVGLLIWVGYRGRTAIRKLIIRVSEIIALITIFVCTLGGGITGLILANARSQLFLNAQDGALAFYSILGFISGGISGFVASALTLALLFLLIEIAENSRKTVDFFERVSSRTQS